MQHFLCETLALQPLKYFDFGIQRIRSMLLNIISEIIMNYLFFNKGISIQLDANSASQGSVRVAPVLRCASGTGNAPEFVKVLITGKLSPVALKILENPPKELALSLPIKLAVFPDCSREVLLKEIVDSHVLITRSETDVDEAVIRAGSVLSVCARAAVGYGNIDLDAATEAGVLVVNTPGKNTNSAAELSIGLLLSMLRRIPAAHASTSTGGWNRHAFTGTEMQGKTIGIVGLGNVGHRVARFARGFDMQVLAYDPYISDEVFRRNHCTRVDSLAEMLSQIDVLTVHVPLNKETKGMVGAAELKKMKKGSLIINAARGGIISEQALLESLQLGHIGGAGIDTWDTEPVPLKDLVSHPLVISTPHIGASTEEAQVRIGEAVAVQTLKALRGEIVDFPVNLPHVSVLGSGPTRQYAVLAEKLSRVATQILDFNPSALKLTVSADLPDSELQILRLSCIKGFLSHASDEFVSYVNADRLLNKKGLKMEVSRVDSVGYLRNGLLFEVEGENNARLKVGAVLYNNELPRLCLINDFMFEIEPEGELIVLQNHDRPGVIGDVGSFLAKSKINIAQFELSRNRAGGMAMAILKIDGMVESPLLQELQSLPNVIFARGVSGL